uniref:G-protein coupled receptors family 2 profile 1 domain-containing protein n=1 Tax=Poecilia latipinna TaxID=48699 RepID=A0A3B3U3C1_9TELE
MSFLKDAAGDESQPHSHFKTVFSPQKLKVEENEQKCLQKMKRDPALNKTAPYCSRNWDGWLCWDDTPAGTLASQSCPDYFSDLNPTAMATKYCAEDGQWFRHPASGVTWTNYTLYTTVIEPTFNPFFIVHKPLNVQNATSCSHLT